MIDFNDSNRAIYLQIADDIADRVLQGVLPPDERIPSVRDYAATVMVNVNTVMRAYEQSSRVHLPRAPELWRDAGFLPPLYSSGAQGPQLQ